jgi:Tat protein translocase TatB subunit
MNIGLGEMILIAAIALVVIGPEKFPDFAKIVIRTVRDVKGYVNDAKRDIAQELKPLKKELKELNRYEPEKYIDTLAKGISEAVSGEQGTDKSQPVAPVAPTEPTEPAVPVAEAASAELDPYAQKQEPGTQPYGGSQYSSARQGEKYEGPERIDG